MNHIQKIVTYGIASGLWLLFIYAVPQNNNTLTDSPDEDLYLIDTSKSRVNWQNYHKGFVKFKKGYFRFKHKEMYEASFTIAMNTIQDEDIENKLLKGTLENVLKSAEFFNTDIFPEAGFELHNVQKKTDGSYRFSGDFILFNNGICHDFTGKISYHNDSLYLDTDYIYIDRTDWGIYYLSANNPNPKDEEESYVVSDSIRLKGHLVAYKKQHNNNISDN